MKRLILVTLTLMMMLTTGCGSDTTVTVVQTVSPPSITALRFSQDRVNLFVTGSIDFLAPDVDLDTMTIKVVNSGGVVISQTVTDLRAFSGLASGTISFSIDYASFLPDTYTFTIQLSDLAGSLSNPVFGTFPVP